MKRPFEIVFLSGKGGTGKTSLTAAFASLVNKAVFADCDVDAADLHLILSPDIYHQESFASGKKAVIRNEKCTRCGLCKELCRFGAIEFKNEVFIIDEFACEGCGLCLQACPAGAISIEKYETNRIYFSNTRFGKLIFGKLGIAEENSGKLVSKIRKFAKQTAVKNNAEFIITDGPPGIGCPVISSVTGADLVIAVTEPTLSGWHDLQRLIEMIERFQTSINVIINKYDLNEDMTEDIIKKLKEKNIPVIGKIPYDENILFALLDGKTITEFHPKGNITLDLNRIWKTIINNIYEPKSI